MRLTVSKSLLSLPALFSLLLTGVISTSPTYAHAATLVVENNGSLGIIKGVVRDAGGTPIADASVAIFRAGTSKLLKQVVSAGDGSFLARIIPGTYTVLAVAQGFNPVTLYGVEVGRAAELTYGFNLERAGNGNTLPEKRADRNSSKWRIRAAQMQRSIYQHQAGDDPLADSTSASATALDLQDDRELSRKGHAVVESYFAGSVKGPYLGVNFATLLPVGETTDVVFAGQTGRGKGVPQRLELGVKLAGNKNHTIRLNSAVAQYSGTSGQKALGQFSVGALDEWKVREGVILVYGIDYSRFFGAGNASALSPRLGLQYDLNAKTRMKAAFTSQTEDRSWAHSIDLEGNEVGFAEPVSIDDLVVANGRPQMNRSKRLEFGVERVLDNRSTIEANIFFDLTPGRGVGLNAVAFDSLGGDGFRDFVADQQGRAQGIRVVYNRRLPGPFTSSAGFSFGKGQKLSAEGLKDPAKMFEDDFFDSFFAELTTDLKSGTRVQTIFRLSPKATVFAVDPFKGSLAIYDPGLNVMVTQNLPNFGLPFRAEAVLDARNIFDFQSAAYSDDLSVRLNAQRRLLRGGIKVQF